MGGADAELNDREARTRQHIVTVAAATFERLGLRRATMDEIAEAAGVARKTLYNYFENKPKLVGEVIEHESTRVAAKAHERLDFSARPEDLIVDAAMVQLELARNSRYFEMLLRHDALAITARVVEQSERIARVQRRFWGPILEPLRESGRLRTDDLDEVVEWLTFNHLVLLTRPIPFRGDADKTRHMLRTYLVPALLTFS
jgi:AcrR family transcriptional regulator